MNVAGADFKVVRAAALRIARSLIEAGHETYFAGGCVRDRLFGFTPTDIDIAQSPPMTGSKREFYQAG